MRTSESIDTGAGRGGAFAIGLLCGAAVGAAVALLLAPKSGEELRSQIAETAEDARRRVRATYDAATGTVNDLAARGQEAVRHGRARIDEAVSALRDATDRGREAYEDARAEMRQ